jgi:hypothetical protein
MSAIIFNIFHLQIEENDTGRPQSTLPRSLYKAHEETCFLAVLTGRSRHSIILLEDSGFSDDNQNHN